MFDHIGDVGLFAIDACCFQGVIEQTAGWSDKRSACQIFFVAWLLAHKHDFYASRASPKTVCVPVFQRSQAWQSAAAFLSEESVGRGESNPLPSF